METYIDKVLRILAEKEKLEAVVPAEKEIVTDDLRRQTFDKLVKEITKRANEINDLKKHLKFFVQIDRYDKVTVATNESADKVELYINYPDNIGRLNVELCKGRLDAHGAEEPRDVNVYDFGFIRGEVGFAITDTSFLSVSYMNDYIFDWFLENVQRSYREK